MSKDIQFTATGTSDTDLTIGFQTDADKILIGAQVTGNRNGVEATGIGSVGVRGTGPETGVSGICTPGDGRPGVSGDSSFGPPDTPLTGIGVQGRAGVGVYGLGFPVADPEAVQFLFPQRGDGVIGDGPINGVHGRSSSTGVFGEGHTVAGVSGESRDGDGTVGTANADNKSGVFGFNRQGGPGVAGNSVRGDGAVGLSHREGKSGVFGFNDAQRGAIPGLPEGVSPGVSGASTHGDGVAGTAHVSDKSGVFGFNDGGGAGVAGFSTGDGVFGHSESDGKSGVVGENTATPGQIGGPGDLLVFGVTGRANAATGIGVFGDSANGAGVSGKGGRYGGVFEGVRAPMRLVPSAISGSPTPTSGLHDVGEFYVDSNGDLFFCKVFGTPGTWVKLA
jgi:hypothetical protein